MKSPHAFWVLLILAPATALGADERVVQQAIDRGVAYLKKHQDARGNWIVRGESTPGATALAGLTLLECDVPPSDRAVQRAADALRPATVSMTYTYSLALAILFLDRMGEPFDDALIQSMGVRLLAGQQSSGGWTYQCPAPPREEVARLTKHLGQHRLTATGRGAKPTTTADNRPALPKELQKLVAKINPESGLQPTDNSNTKFATLALWVARRHGVPVESALAQVEKRFRNSQNGDGGWGYFPQGRGAMGQSLASMTCAGLLGLAFGHASAAEVTLRTQPRANDASPKMDKGAMDPARDPSIRGGLLFLARVVGEPLDRANPPISLYNAKGDEYYFLWAVERVAVAYGLNTIGNKDWFDWGAKYLLSRQAKNGSWTGRLQANVDTCFALLFLRRANLSRDLTATLKGQINDPSQGASRGAKENKTAKPIPATPKPEPAQDVNAEIARLTKALIDAPAEKQKAMIGEYEKAKGVAYTQALAGAVAKLNPAHQKQARDALAQRLARMTAATLTFRLKDDDPEMRRAAALACAMKEEKSHVPQLIPLLNDSNAHVARAAHAALKSLTGKDFGPTANANRDERQRAIDEWTKWWKAAHGDSGS